MMCELNSAHDLNYPFHALYHLTNIAGILLDILYDPYYGNITEYYFIQHIDKGFG
jgi:hypothetical protein